uniref:Uncharacterized protein n=1 Tax=Anopheles coluzzii TaxID=1518534 RepID=A0A8W7PX03_ANOCL
MSLDNRNTSAQYKRAEQLKRWEESEMNKKLSGAPKSPSSRRIKFSSGCIFLAACVAGDKEEVEWLLKNGADIDTANVDGLTALHQRKKVHDVHGKQNDEKFEFNDPA